MTERRVGAVWEGGMRCSVDAGGFPITVDEPPEAGGTGLGPQPTELLLGAIASCFTLALAYTAAKRGVELRGLHVDATGTYDGPRFSALRIDVRAETPTGPDLDRLATAAARVCYVTNTLRTSPPIEITTA
jgi:organic hydroperoxide reductase OsmC/OhrA